MFFRWEMGIVSMSEFPYWTFKGEPHPPLNPDPPGSPESFREEKQTLSSIESEGSTASSESLGVYVDGWKMGNQEWSVPWVGPSRLFFLE